MPLDDRAHAVLADAEVQVAAAVVVRLETAGAFELEIGFGRRRQIRRTADAATERAVAIAFSTLPDESRVAMPFASASNTGMSASQPSGNCDARIWLNSLASSPCFLL